MAKYFEGKVQIKKMITEKLTKDFEVYLIIFEDGARTKLHYHEFEQVLIAVEGKGIVALQTGINQTGDNIGLIKIDEIHYLDEGDFVCIPLLNGTGTEHRGRKIFSLSNQKTSRHYMG